MELRKTNGSMGTLVRLGSLIDLTSDLDTGLYFGVNGEDTVEIGEERTRGEAFARLKGPFEPRKLTYPGT